MISIDDYMAGGFQWTYHEKPVGKFHKNKDRFFGAHKEQVVDIVITVPMEDAEALCTMAIDRCMRVGDFLANEIAYMVRRWKSA